MPRRSLWTVASLPNLTIQNRPSAPKSYMYLHKFKNLWKRSITPTVYHFASSKVPLPSATKPGQRSTRARKGLTSGKLQINLHYLGHFEKCQSDESELKWPPDSHLAQEVAALQSGFYLTQVQTKWASHKAS